MRLILTLTLAVPLLFGACTEVQTTSGADYLAGYAPVESDAQPLTTRVVTQTRKGAEVVEYTTDTLSTDQLVRRAAAVEPLLKLPARIGLARIENGRLTTIPDGESMLWHDLAKRHARLASFTMIDPFLADYTLRTVLPQDKRTLRRDASSVITRIRLGAARQHADAVLIYEVGARRGIKGVDGLRPISVLGAAPLPAQPIKREGIARAFLMDVRNGYPYGTASASADLGALQNSFWTDKPKDPLAIEAKTSIVRALAPNVEAMMERLIDATARREPTS